MNKYIVLAVVVFVLLVSLVVSDHFHPLNIQQAYPGPSTVSTSSVALNIASTEGSVLSSPPRSTSSQPNTNKIATQKVSEPPKVVSIHAEMAFDAGDDKVLMGASHNVFVGKVINEIGTRPGLVTPLTLFTVGVIFNIKGSLLGTVTVYQQAGYKGGVLMVMEGDRVGPANNKGAGYLLQPGSTYLFATRYDSEGVYALISASPAVKLISEDSTLSNYQLQTLAMNDDRVIQLEQAYPNEVLLDADIAHNNARNSYQSLSAEQKAALPQPPPPPPPAPPVIIPPAPSSTLPTSTNS